MIKKILLSLLLLGTVIAPTHSAAARGHQTSSLDHAVRGKSADHTLFIDAAHRPVYIEEAPPAVPTDEPPLVPFFGNAFTLHSRPGAALVIYLDATGHETTNTAWNVNGNTIVSAPWGLDTDPVYSSAEQSRIYQWWLQVSEDYAPWNVDVTTEEPAGDHGIRVVISPTNWYDGSAGGVAYVGSFSWTNDTPVFIFSDQLNITNSKSVSEAISHEVGHSLGLHHDGYFTDAYYLGHGAWAPIMGVAYYRAVSQWSKGEYTGATNTEDDLAIIGQTLSIRPDTEPFVIPFPASVSGLISNRADTDRYQFTIPAGTLTATTTLSAPSPNLDAVLRLFDQNGVLIASSNPASVGAPSLTGTLAAGTYVIEIDGTSSVDYSDYASLGRYTLNLDSTTSPTTTTIVASTTTTTTTTVVLTTTVAPTSTTTTIPAPTTTRACGNSNRPGCR